MGNYIIRIYRFQKDDPRGLVGTAELVENKKRRKWAFTNIDDLWEILNSQMSGTVLFPQGGIPPPGFGGGENPFKKGG